MVDRASNAPSPRFGVVHFNSFDWGLAIRTPVDTFPAEDFVELDGLLVPIPSPGE
jgi:hypothetical protein